MKHLITILIIGGIFGRLYSKDTQVIKNSKIDAATTAKDILLANNLMDQFERTKDLQNLIDAAKQMKVTNGPFDDARYQTGLRRDETRSLIRVFALVYANKDLRLSDSEKADINFFIHDGSIRGDDASNIIDPNERAAAILKLKKKHETRNLLNLMGEIQNMESVMEFTIPMYLRGLYSNERGRSPNEDDLKELKDLIDESNLPEQIKINLFACRVPITGKVFITPLR